MSKMTDNGNLTQKVELRRLFLPKKKTVAVLDCYHGCGVVWNEVARLSPKVSIKVIGIDKLQKSAEGFLGDNRKWLPALDLSKFDVIDLDAYGCPFDQLAILFEKRYSGVVFVTFNQRFFGHLPLGLLAALGYSRTMVKKFPTMFAAGGVAKMLQYLANMGVPKVSGYFLQKGRWGRGYFAFQAAPRTP